MISQKEEKVADKTTRSTEAGEEEGKKDLSFVDTTLPKQMVYYNRIRGQRSQTKELNIHVKTLFEKHMKRCILANQFCHEDKAVFVEYKKKKANFQTTKYLFESISPTAKQSFFQYCKSPEIVRDVLASDRMLTKNKLIFIKYLKKIEGGIHKPNYYWKLEYFKNKTKKRENDSQSKSSDNPVQGQQDEAIQENVRASAIIINASESKKPEQWILNNGLKGFTSCLIPCKEGQACNNSFQ